MKTSSSVPAAGRFLELPLPDPRRVCSLTVCSESVSKTRSDLAWNSEKGIEAVEVVVWGGEVDRTEGLAKARWRDQKLM